MSQVINPPYTQYQDLDGQPLENGYIYIGEPNQNPETAPLAIFYDADLTQAAAQPLRTLNGYVVYAGTPANIYVNSNYSITVRNQQRELVITKPSEDTSGLSATVLLTGQMVLEYTSPDALTVLPRNGNKVVIENAERALPDAGKTFDPSALVANTRYNNYLYWDGAAIQSESSATAPVRDTTTGIMIKTGDDSRSYVGSAFTIDSGGTKWSSDSVDSWFNNPGSQRQLLISGADTIIATLDLVLPPGYASYQLEIITITPVTDMADLWLRVSQDYGTTYKSGASDYSWTSYNNADGGMMNPSGDATDTKIILAQALGNAANKSFNGSLMVYEPANTQRHKIFGFFYSYESAANAIVVANTGGNFQLNTTAVTNIRLMMSSGALTIVYKLYGARSA